MALFGTVDGRRKSNKYTRNFFGVMLLSILCCILTVNVYAGLENETGQEDSTEMEGTDFSEQEQIQEETSSFTEETTSAPEQTVPDAEETSSAPEETSSDSEETSAPEAIIETTAAERNTAPVALLQCREIVFEGESKEFNEYILTNNTVRVIFEVNMTGNLTEAYYCVNGERKDSIVVNDRIGELVLDSDLCGLVEIFCEDDLENQTSCTVGNIMIDKQIPVLTASGEGDTISILPDMPLNIIYSDEEGGSGLSSVYYSLDGQTEEAAVEDGFFTLTFSESGVHELYIVAQDNAGNAAELTKYITVKEAPIVSVTIPTNIEVIILSQTIEEGVNIFSNSFDVVNRSNVPVKIKIAEYRMDSTFEGSFQNSFLNLEMQFCSVKEVIPLGFNPLNDIYEFNLAASEYSGREYVSSGEQSIARFNYRGFADTEFNEYLRIHKAEFSLLFTFEAVEE